MNRGQQEAAAGDGSGWRRGRGLGQGAVRGERGE